MMTSIKRKVSEYEKQTKQLLDLFSQIQAEIQQLKQADQVTTVNTEIIQDRVISKNYHVVNSG